jgi:hypothetical protein
LDEAAEAKFVIDQAKATGGANRPPPKSNKNVLITTVNLLPQIGAASSWLPQSFSLSIHSRTFAGQFSSFIPSASQSLRDFNASRSANLTSRRAVHDRDTCSKFFCRVSLIERNAIPVNWISRTKQHSCLPALPQLPA